MVQDIRDSRHCHNIKGDGRHYARLQHRIMGVHGICSETMSRPGGKPMNNNNKVASHLPRLSRPALTGEDIHSIHERREADPKAMNTLGLQGIIT